MRIGYSPGILYYITITLLGIIIYYPSIHAPFYLDDTNNILENVAIEFDKIDIQNISDLSKVDINKNRIVSYATFGLSYLFYKYDHKGYHYLNIFIVREVCVEISRH